MNTINPYAPPKARVLDVLPPTSEAEVIRREHIKHEASIRSVGMLYYIGGCLMGIASFGFLATLGVSHETMVGVLGAVYLVLGALSIFVGRGLRMLRPWGRTTAIVLSCIGVLGFPVGTIIHGYILYLLLSQKGKRIFEEDYPEIVAATPDIKYRTSVVVWIVLALVLLLIVGIFASLAVQSRV